MTNFYTIRKLWIQIGIPPTEVTWIAVGEKWVQKEVTITESVQVFEWFDLYNEDDEVIGSHQVRVMESEGQEDQSRREQKERESLRNNEITE